jgi:ubiquinone/menaquinone biosynthesis C-methylase UbiE
MLAARLVGSTGEVVGVDRDARSISRAESRASEAGLRNVRFVEFDVADIPSDRLFDAAVGRYILQFLPDPVGVLRSLSRLVRPGGIIAFQENSWAPFVALSANVPLWSTGVRLLHEVSRRFGVNLEMGPELHKTFLAAGLPAPSMRLEVPLSNEPDITRWVSDTVRAVLPQFKKFDIAIDSLGDLDTLQERLHEAVTASNTVVPLLCMVGAWCRIPTDDVIDPSLSASR